MPARLVTSDHPGNMSSEEARAWCHAILPRVSRTFALNIRLLPGALGDAVTQAYLFCRIADTVEDSPHLDPNLKSSSLAEYSDLFPLQAGWEERVRLWQRCFDGLGDRGADHALCAHALTVFRGFESLPVELREPVEACVREMALGMRSFVQRRLSAPAARLQLETLEELEEYCHYVAGTVGHMLCRLFAHVSRHLRGDRLLQMERLAERFGLAMQLTNIIKDVAEDAARGACYVPRALAARHGLPLEEIFSPTRRSAARAVVRELAAHAVEALDAAMRFTLILPRREVRLRLFCLWPLFLAVRTLGSVVGDDLLFVPGGRPRISRREVRSCIRRATLAVLSNRALQQLYSGERQRLDRILQLNDHRGVAAARAAF